ncbi:MAG: hypothetical protein J0L92_03620 [Deltaproteobacteria bacterium]|nr:hypothetical protein [Deltaproteobacteria bacterium]
MSKLVLDAIAADVAMLTRVVEPPTDPIGWGSDLSCGEDLTEGMDEVTGQRLLAEAVIRRLTTPRGSLPDVRSLDLRDRNYGLDLASYLNRGVTALEVRALATNVRSEVSKDDRLANVSVTVTPSPTGSSLAVELRITPRDSRLGPFSLVLAVTDAGVLVEELRGGR